MPRYITTLPFDADCAFGARVCRSLEGAFVLGIFNCYFHVHCHLKEITQRGRLTLTSHFSIFNHFAIALWLEQQKEILPTIYFVFVLFFISFTIHTEYMYIQCYVGPTYNPPQNMPIKEWAYRSSHQVVAVSKPEKRRENHRIPNDGRT